MSGAAQHGAVNGTRPGPAMLEGIAALRTQLSDEGFRPVAVFSYDHGEPKERGKRPIGRDWDDRARRDPPEAAAMPAVAHAMNTGILCDGLRGVDVDVDDHELAGVIRARAQEMLGETIGRYRSNSGRCLLPYRAAEGEPAKRRIVGKLGKVEVLGRGQQFVSHGTHESGAKLYWSPAPPEEVGRDNLPAVTEEQITAFLRAVAPLIEADPAKVEEPARERDHEPRAYDGAARDELLDVIAALAAIPNDGPPDWEFWNNVGMAAWLSTGGDERVFAAWRAWSAQHPTYDDAACRKRWDTYPTCPPDRIGVGWLYKLAHEAIPGWRRPSETRAEARKRGPEPQPWPEAGPEPSPDPGDAGTERTPGLAKAPKAPSIWLDDDNWAEAEIPQRPWIVPNYLLRGAVSLIIGPPSAMKSSLALLWATACALNKGVGNFKPIGASKVVLYNVEDNMLEQRRRLSATLRQFGANPPDLRGKLYRVGPNAIGTLCKRGDGEKLYMTDAMAELAKHIEEIKPDVFVVDPFSELHTDEENDNTAIRAVMAAFRGLAQKHNMAVVILHHTHKGGNLTPSDPDIARGASAIIGAARVAFTLLNMSDADAQAMGVEKDPNSRKHYVRLDGAKSNYAPLADAQWFEKAAYLLDNGETVAAAVPWTPPAAKNADQGDLSALLSAIEAGSLHHEAKGLPYSPRLGDAEPRSIKRLLDQHGFVGSAAQKRVIEQLEERGLEKAEFLSPRRHWVAGYRHNGLPAVKWKDAGGDA